MYSDESLLLVYGSVFTNNRAGSFGGAIASFHNSSLTTKDSHFVNNSAQSWVTGKQPNIFDDASAEGGAIHLLRSVLVCYCSVFYNNYAQYAGGSAYSMESTLSIHGSKFHNNIADFFGAALNIGKQSSLIIEDSSLMDNAGEQGGGLFIHIDSSVMILNVTLVTNQAADTGGAILATSDCQITVLNSLFLSNIGSAISLLSNTTLFISQSTFYNNSGAITGTSHCEVNVTNSSFIQNKASEGGSLHITMAAIVYLQNCSFIENAALKGGAVAAVNSDVKVFSCRFLRNKARNGGVIAISGNLVLNNSLISHNIADLNGGVLYLDINSIVNIIATTFTGNRAFIHGGVLSMTGCTAKVLNSSFVSNQAGINGGVIDAQYSSIIDISHTTCHGNRATNGHGGVVHARVNTKVYVHNSIFVKNFAHTCGAVLIDGASVLKINFSQVDRSNASGPSGALCAFNSSSSIVRTSSFQGNNGFVSGSYALKNSIGYLDNCTFIRNRGIYVGAITFSFSELRLSNTVFLHNMAQSAGDISSDTGTDKFVNKMYSYRCVFKHDNITLKSNSTNFEKLALKEGFLKQSSLYEQTNFVAEETQFASSKLLYLKLFFILMSDILSDAMYLFSLVPLYVSFLP